MKKGAFIFIILFFYLPVLSADNQKQKKIDSLLYELQNVLEDTNKVNILCDISSQYVNSNLDKGMEYGGKALKLAKDIGWKEGQAKALKSLGSNYKQKHDYPKALEYYAMSLNIYEDIGDKKLMNMIFTNMGIIYKNQSEYTKAIEYYNKSLKICEDIGDKFGIAYNLGNIGVIHKIQLNYTKALEFYQKSLMICEDIGDKSGIALTLGNIGLIYDRQSDYAKALKYYLKSLKIFEEIGNNNGINACLGNIGNVFEKLSNYAKALQYYQRALKVNEEIGNSNGIATMLGNIGVIYSRQSDYAKALQYHFKSLNVYEEIGNKNETARTLNNIGDIYNEKSYYSKAIEYYHKALKINKEIGDTMAIAYNICGIGVSYYSLSQDSLMSNGRESQVFPRLNNRLNIDRSIDYLLQAVKMFEDIEDNNALQNALSFLANAYTEMGDYKNALEYYQKHITIKDSIFSEETQTKIANLEAKRENDLMKKDMEKLEVEKDLQQTRTYYLSAVSLLALIAIIIGFFFYRNKRRSNRWLSAKNKVIQDANIELDSLNNDLAEKNQQIVHANIELDTLNTDLANKNYEISEANEKITSSISYASNIQTAMLPFPSRMKEILHDYFVLYIPKDIVSGDFYWIEKIDGRIFIVVADCTGHGVPGAFMSMIGNELLNNIVIKQRIFDPVQVLSEMHKDVRFALKQEESESKTPDGMDVCMCVLENNKLTFAGAKRPLYIVKNGEFVEIKGDKKSIGGRQKEEDRTFTNNEIELQSGMMIYLTTDGYQDQHNINQKKYGVKRFRELLHSIADKPMEEQKNLLEKELNEFSQGEKNRDDISVMGVKT